MNDALKTVIINLIDEHGKSVLRDSKKFKSMVKDYYQGLPREINILGIMIDSGIVNKIINSNESLEKGDLNLLLLDVEDHLGISRNLAEDAIMLWLDVLGKQYSIADLKTQSHVTTTPAQVQTMTSDIKQLKHKAQNGDPASQNNLGECYENGDGVEQNYTEAVKWYRMAVEQGHARAQWNLGYCYQNGYGVGQNNTKAVKWYRRAAEQGDPVAQYSLGECYHNGYGLDQNYTVAVKWYRMAAEQGHAAPQCRLGECYHNGDGVEQNDTEAVKWYRMATEQGHARAQYNLGECYHNGDGLEQNDTEAVKWYRMAAEQGHAKAQYNLGVCYDNGYGIEQNNTEAVKWYHMAAEQGHAEAQYNLDLTKFKKQQEESKMTEAMEFVAEESHEMYKGIVDRAVQEQDDEKLVKSIKLMLNGIEKDERKSPDVKTKAKELGESIKNVNAGENFGEVSQSATVRYAPVWLRCRTKHGSRTRTY